MASTLLQSTAATIQLGPFLDKTDGVTEETGVSPTINLSKAGGALTARNSATAISHDADGWYRVPLDATDTNTLGSLIAYAQDPATHLPVWREFIVRADSVSPMISSHYVGPIKASTAFEITVGPFISVSTNRPLTSLTVANITGQLSKGGSATGATITLTASGGSNDLVHIGNGLWSLELSATDTNTNGWLTVQLTDDDVFYPVVTRGFVYSTTIFGGFWDTYMPANIKAVDGDTSVFTAGTEKLLRVDVHAISADETDADDLGAAIDNTNNVVKADVIYLSGDATAADNLEAASDGTGYNLGAGQIQSDVRKINNNAAAAAALKLLMDGAETYDVDDASAAPTTTTFETTATEATADHYIDRIILFVTGNLAGSAKAVTDYALVGGRGYFTVDAFVEAPADGDTFILA